MTLLRDDCEVVVGRALTGEELVLDLISEAHWLVTGQTRSGKSVFLYSLLSQLACYPHVRVVGIDFSQLLLRPFARRFTEPWIVQDGDNLAGAVEVLEELKAEMDSRNRFLAGTMADKFDQFAPRFPLIVAVLEEYPGTIARLKGFDTAAKRDEKLLPRFQSLVSSLMAESAKAGIRLILIAQRPDADIVGGAARENMPVRIAFKQGGQEAYRMMYPDIDVSEVETVKAQPPGVGMIETPRLSRKVFKGPFVEVGSYLRHVQSCDLDYMRDLGIDRKFRLTVADEWPEIGDPDNSRFA